MSVTKEVQLKILVTKEERDWLDELATDANVSVTRFIKDFIRSAHGE
jgi:hypothetical protein